MKGPRMSKMSELITAIQNNHFPIVVCGPSGTGKTKMIYKALEALHLKWRYVELSESTINKPLVRGLIIHTVLNNVKDLVNMNHKGNVIIETILNVQKSEYLEGAKIIKINRRQNDAEDVDMYRFLGKVFYKKLTVRNIDVNENRIIYEIPQTVSNSERSVPVEKSEMNGSRNKGRRFLVTEDSEGSLSSCAISFDEDFTFSSPGEDLTQQPQTKIKALQKVLESARDLKDEVTAKVVSFDMAKIEGYLYENFPYFLDFEDYVAVCDSFSLYGSTRHPSSLFCVIQSILKGKGPVTRKFTSFLSPSYFYK